ncbi:hypothetical protein BO70DRAFT_25560 [Aspergillus heteromorphus CBS 117.55]|uniref:Uncharacterized protein n=1 Tax=Aspergillus heteromorphus CBS 117.55 TaxID=1448321 RepID=A0A317WDP4_9EURO|nr:uncharacterized protein BO70DRAFT_25560 [Aspergillus heteromorphus CBS 117.55]PWY83427.1 hypothetical protein BO70DRAFT_25560 [Aspergillus heteromorphus CBS 117.55]
MYVCMYVTTMYCHCTKYSPPTECGTGYIHTYMGSIGRCRSFYFYSFLFNEGWRLGFLLSLAQPRAIYSGPRNITFLDHRLRPQCLFVGINSRGPDWACDHKNSCLRGLSFPSARRPLTAGHVLPPRPTRNACNLQTAGGDSPHLVSFPPTPHLILLPFYISSSRHLPARVTNVFFPLLQSYGTPSRSVHFCDLPPHPLRKDQAAESIRCT